MEISAEVRAQIEHDFSGPVRQKAAELVSTYGEESYEREPERVVRGILMLSEGDLGKLAYFVEIAKLDYRDILYWAYGK